MKVQIDESQFDDLQMEVGYAIAHEVYTALKKAGFPDSAQLEEIVQTALFHIGCLLDGSAEVKGPDGPMQVVLTFRKHQHDSTLISGGGTSWIHEYASGIAEDYFDRLAPKRARSSHRPVKTEEQRLNLLDVIATGWFGRRPKR